MGYKIPLISLCILGFVILVNALSGSAPENGPRYVFSGGALSRSKPKGSGINFSALSRSKPKVSGINFSAIRVKDNNQRFTISQGKQTRSKKVQIQKSSAPRILVQQAKRGPPIPPPNRLPVPPQVNKPPAPPAANRPPLPPPNNRLPPKAFFNNLLPPANRPPLPPPNNRSPPKAFLNTMLPPVNRLGPPPNKSPSYRVKTVMTRTIVSSGTKNRPNTGQASLLASSTGKSAGLSSVSSKTIVKTSGSTMSSGSANRPPFAPVSRGPPKRAGKPAPLIGVQPLPSLGFVMPVSAATIPAPLLAPSIGRSAGLSSVSSKTIVKTSGSIASSASANRPPSAPVFRGPPKGAGRPAPLIGVKPIPSLGFVMPVSARKPAPLLAPSMGRSAGLSAVNYKTIVKTSGSTMSSAIGNKPPSAPVFGGPPKGAGRPAPLIGVKPLPSLGFVMPVSARKPTPLLAPSMGRSANAGLSSVSSKATVKTSRATMSTANANKPPSLPVVRGPPKGAWKPASFIGVKPLPSLGMVMPVSAKNPVPLLGSSMGRSAGLSSVSSKTIVKTSGSTMSFGSANRPPLAPVFRGPPNGPWKPAPSIGFKPLPNLGLVKPVSARKPAPLLTPSMGRSASAGLSSVSSKTIVKTSRAPMSSANANKPASPPVVIGPPKGAWKPAPFIGVKPLPSPGMGIPIIAEKPVPMLASTTGRSASAGSSSVSSKTIVKTAGASLSSTSANRPPSSPVLRGLTKGAGKPAPLTGIRPLPAANGIPVRPPNGLSPQVGQSFNYQPLVRSQFIANAGSKSTALSSSAQGIRQPTGRRVQSSTFTDSKSVTKNNVVGGLSAAGSAGAPALPVKAVASPSASARKPVASKQGAFLSSASQSGAGAAQHAPSKQPAGSLVSQAQAGRVGNQAPRSNAPSASPVKSVPGGVTLKRQSVTGAKQAMTASSSTSTTTRSLASAASAASVSSRSGTGKVALGGPVFSTKTSRQLVFTSKAGTPANGGTARVNTGGAKKTVQTNTAATATTATINKKVTGSAVPSKTAPNAAVVPTQGKGPPSKPVPVNDKKTDEKNGARTTKTSTVTSSSTSQKGAAVAKVAPVAKSKTSVPSTSQKGAAVAKVAPVAKSKTSVPVASTSVAVKEACVWSPICGDDLNTYPGNCALPQGVVKACNGHCPCDQGASGSLCGCENAFYYPVCSIYGKTYANECELFCEFIPMECDGACPCPKSPPTTPAPAPAPEQHIPSLVPLSSCSCNEYYYQPVCGVDGQVYHNDCFRVCEGVHKECEGTCPCDSALNLQNVDGCSQCDPDEWNPVCGTDGNTYRSLCKAQCSEVEVACSSECPC